MSSKTLFDIEIKPLSSVEERDKLFELSYEWGVSPIFPTHIVYKK